ncbi:unnamed protein product [Medioppia subpectinata]|uniref:Uncharacterized protein n=1 Tax=Medioppia subpectinata TaxID=1979941 RepID=A0A7R9KIF9_9ACAR|nr:unnamed protein product [Medioppia subpectinata]CAG2103926.1 unnamed protein product [Medioppia subpectinata]
MLVDKINNLVVRAIVCLALLIGCIWHIVNVSVIYFRYETTVSVVLEKAQVIELPSFTICTNVSYAIDADYLRHRYPNDTALANITDTNENKWQYNQYLSNLTLEEQLLNGTIGANRFFNECKVLIPRAMSLSDTWIDCDLIAPVVQSISIQSKCFTMFSQNLSQLADNDKYRVDHDVMFRDSAFALIWFGLNVRYLQEVTIYMHDRREPFVGNIGGQLTYMDVDYQHYINNIFSYKVIDIKQLPSPYQTQCVDYPLLGFRSHTHRVGQCRAKYYRDHFAGWQPDMIYRNEYYGKLNYTDISLTNNRTVDKQLAADCAHQIGRRPDCHSVYYTMNKVYSHQRVNNSNDSAYSYVSFNMPAGTITRYVHSPRMELAEYMGYIGGVSGLWFGLNILAFYDIGQYLVRKARALFK